MLLLCGQISMWMSAAPAAALTDSTARYQPLGASVLRRVVVVSRPGRDIMISDLCTGLTLRVTVDRQALRQRDPRPITQPCHPHGP